MQFISILILQKRKYYILIYIEKKFVEMPEKYIYQELEI